MAEGEQCVCGTLQCNVPFGLCHCGCGKKTTLVKRNYRYKGLIKGKPNKYLYGHAAASLVIHGHARRGAKPGAYTRWNGMKARCINPKSSGYSDYGGRGITICERWKKFENFLADMGEPPQGLSLDRIDVNGNYEPSNCRWATKTEQNSNRRSYTIKNTSCKIRVRPKTIRPPKKVDPHPNVNWVEFDVARYWPRWLALCVQKDGCWLWQGYCVKGYPQYRVHKRSRLVHRLAYMSVFGPIPDGKELDHICNQPRCINPFHSNPLTPRENSMRSEKNACAVNLRRKSCKQGHPLDSLDVRGYRKCSICLENSRYKTQNQELVNENNQLHLQSL